MNESLAAVSGYDADILCAEYLGFVNGALDVLNGFWVVFGIAYVHFDGVLGYLQSCTVNEAGQFLTTLGISV